MQPLARVLGSLDGSSAGPSVGLQLSTTCAAFSSSVTVHEAQLIEWMRRSPGADGNVSQLQLGKPTPCGIFNVSNVAEQRMTTQADVRLKVLRYYGVLQIGADSSINLVLADT